MQSQQENERRGLVYGYPSLVNYYRNLQSQQANAQHRQNQIQSNSEPQRQPEPAYFQAPIPVQQLAQQPAHIEQNVEVDPVAKSLSRWRNIIFFVSLAICV